MNFELGDRVITAQGRGASVIETLAMTEGTSVHGRVKIRSDSGITSWLWPDQLRVPSYQGWPIQ